MAAPSIRASGFFFVTVSTLFQGSLDYGCAGGGDHTAGFKTAICKENAGTSQTRRTCRSQRGQ